MAVRKTSHPGRRSTTKPTRPKPPSRRLSGLFGIGLVSLALFWFVWLYLHQVNPGLSFLTLTTQSQSTASDPLTAAGITLTTPAQGEQPRLTRQQALLLANQIEPGVAGRAGAVNAQYTLFSYQSTRASQPAFHNLPTWLIHYSQISEPPPDLSDDSHASRAHHDFYLFLDANTGRELLAVWL